MCSYLNSDRAVYAFRRSVPEHLRAYFLTATGKPRTEWRVSLATKNREEAKARCHLKAVETDRLIEDAQALLDAGKPPRRAANAKARKAEDEWFEAEMLQIAASVEDDAVSEYEWESRETERQALLDQLGRPISSLNSVERSLRELIPDEEFDPPEVQARRALERQSKAHQGAIEGLERLKDLWAGKPSYPTVTAMFEGYVQETGPAPSTVKRWKGVITQFVDFLGHDDPRKVTASDLRRWKSALAGSRSKDRLPLSQLTIRDVYFAAAKATFSWGVENGQVELNPFLGLKVRVRRKVITRGRDFTEQEALTILKACLLPPSENLSAQRALSRRWVPWICAYTGARVNEITQLRGTDVVNIGGIWAIRITPEAGGQKENRARTVPLHSHLIEQGFPDVAKKAGQSPIFYDPKLARGGSEGNPQYKKTGERLALWVRAIGVTDPTIQPNHAWRHTFKSLDRRYDLHLDAADAITGHAPTTEGRRYGERDLDFLSKQIEKIARFAV